MAEELTQAMIADGMARAEKVACRPGDDRCYVFPDKLEAARATCTPKGRCMIGWIVANSGRDSWDVWLDVHTGEDRLRRQTNRGARRSPPRSRLTLGSSPPHIGCSHRRSR